jgi:molybdopterin-guanine dinucleotide biosynthesis protein A
MATPTRAELTGLVLAGGRGRRMAGADKGLVLWHGEPLLAHVLRRLRPQVAQVLISANRNLERYRAWAPVVADADPASFDGPLAGIAAALPLATHDWLAIVPCDLPQLPADAFARLAAGLQGARAAHAVAGERHTLVCLVHRSAAEELAARRAGDDRRVQSWLAAIASRPVAFADSASFANFNTAADLDSAEQR